MLTPDAMMAFFAAALLLSIAPGPDNIFVLTQSALFGVGAGIITTLGLVTGLCVHTTAVALGVAAIFQTSARAFTLLKVAGAGYLLWLAFAPCPLSCLGPRWARLSSVAHWPLPAPTSAQKTCKKCWPNSRRQAAAGLAWQPVSAMATKFYHTAGMNASPCAAHLKCWRRQQFCGTKRIFLNRESILPKATSSPGRLLRKSIWKTA